MVEVHVTGSNGVERVIEARVGESLMEAIRDNGFDELLALCGGSCACATCHVHVDADWLSHVGPASGDEDDLLHSSDVRQSNSRLSCQITVSEALQGLRVTIAKID